LFGHESVINLPIHGDDAYRCYVLTLTTIAVHVATGEAELNFGQLRWDRVGLGGEAAREDPPIIIEI
jgi:hypothetical protein